MEKVTGVYWNKVEGKWRAQIKVKGKTHHLGSFDKHSDAVRARRKAEKEFGFEKIRDLSDLQGERFGLYTVIGDTGKTNNMGKILLCRHDDGTLREISKNSLVQGIATGQPMKPIGKSGEIYINVMKNGKYRVQIPINKKRESFGVFQTLPEAVAKRDEILLLIEQGKL